MKELSDISSIPTRDLYDRIETIISRVGLKHWLLAAVWREIYRRSMDNNAEPNFSAVSAALGMLEWFASRPLPPPPKAVGEELLEMGFLALEFLQPRIHGVRDLRVVFLKAVEVVRGVINLIERRSIDRLTYFSGCALNIRRLCAFCKARLPEPPADNKEKEEESESADGLQDGSESCYSEQGESAPVTCRICMELSYCDLSCQLSDMKRHKPYCWPQGESFSSPVVRRILVPTRD